jgi:hypothetical protein
VTAASAALLRYANDMNRRPAEIVFLVQEAPEGGFTARALGESIFTEADTMEALRQEVRDAVRCHFEPDSGPYTIRLHRVHEEVLIL